MPKATKSPTPRKRTSKTTKPNTSGSLVLADKLELKHIRIIESRSKLTIAENAAPENIQTETHVQFSGSTDGHVLGDVTVQLSTKEGEQTGSAKKSSIFIFVHCQCIFAAPNAPADREISEHEASVLNATAMQISWPYLRAHVQYLSAGMGITPILLPLLRVGLSIKK